MSKIKVLHISKRYPPYLAGIETVCHDVAETLKDDGGYDEHVIAYNDKPDTLEEIYEGVPLTRVGVQKVIASQPLGKDYGKVVEKMMRDFKPDIIHFHYPNPYAAHFVLKYMKKYHFKGKFILHYHCDITKQKLIKMFFVSQIKKMIKIADVIVVTSPALLKDTDYLPDYPDKKYMVVPCRVGDSRLTFSSTNKLNGEKIKAQYQGKKILFFFGRHVEYKGLKYLIDADEYLDRSKVQIIIAGSGPLTEELKAQAAKYNNISFPGVLSNSQVNEYLYACDIFTYPSITRNEAFGIALAEAMYFGKPAVTFTIKGSGVNWVNLDKVTGLEAQNSDSKDYADKLNQLLNDDAFYNKMAEGAKKRCDELFTKKHFDESVNEVYSFIEKGM